MAASPEQVPVVAAAAAADAVPLPPPPYTDGDDITSGVACYGCKDYTGDSWHKLFQHMKKKHGLKMSQIHGTFFYKKAREEMNAIERNRIQKDPVAKAAAAPVGDQPLPSSSAAAACIPDKVLLKDPAVRAKDGQVVKGPGGSYWRAMWVLHVNGDPAVPTNVEEIEGWELRSAHAVQPSMPAMPVVAVPPPSGNPPDALVEIKDLLAKMNQSNGAWKEGVPALRIKEAVLACQPPPAKGEGVQRATFPKSLTGPRMELPAFGKFLKTSKANQAQTNTDHVFNVSRMLGLLEADWGTGWTNIDSTSVATDVRLVCGLVANNMYEDILDLPILDLKFSWAEDMLEALIVYVRWHVQDVAGRMVAGDDGPLKQYDAVLRLLLERLTGGYRKRASAAREKKLAAKQAEDGDRIKKLPAVHVRRAAVEKAYFILSSLDQMYGKTNEPLPRETRAMANACLVGAIWLDSFGGRKAEWEGMTASHVQAMLADGHDYLLCPVHKTSRTYGSIAKWLSPGLRCAVASYLRLPRHAGVELFLVPANVGTEHVDVPSAFRTFCSHLLPSDCSTPTVNLMRKLFHTKLIDITKDEESLKAIMSRLDGHSVRTINRHYCLREPAHDVALAKELVAAILGTTAAWPSGGGVGIATAELEDVWKQLHAAAPECDEGKGDPEDYLEPELEYWDFGEFFGIRKPLEVLCGPDGAASSSMPVLCDVPGLVDGNGHAAEDGACGGEPPLKKGNDVRQEEAPPLKKHKAAVDEGLRRRSRLDPDTLAWVEKEHAEHLVQAGLGKSQVASTSWFHNIRDSKVASGGLCKFVTAEGLR
jgi:hypothetical protein